MNRSIRLNVELGVGVLGLFAGLAAAELAILLVLAELLPAGRSAPYPLIVGVASPVQGLLGGMAGVLAGTALLRAEPRRLSRRLAAVVAALAAAVMLVILLRSPQAMGPDPGAVVGKALGAGAGLWLAARIADFKRRPRPDAGR